MLFWLLQIINEIQLSLSEWQLPVERNGFCSFLPRRWVIQTRALVFYFVAAPVTNCYESFHSSPLKAGLSVLLLPSAKSGTQHLMRDCQGSKAKSNLRGKGGLTMSQDSDEMGVTSSPPSLCPSAHIHREKPQKPVRKANYTALLQMLRERSLCTRASGTMQRDS